MPDNPIGVTIIGAIVIITSVWGLVKVIKPFLFPKKKGNTIARSSRNQEHLIGRRIKK